ncbi:site-specific integrase [uncultured Chryseobacterium sp.]|jgi:Site-specific recombinase XerD|uniref:tyrosine-type recombinase/integrase n=1 Tax=uncultured Chryseobacterium sp. TaxID=259322 RepID=UPI002609396D|nr:site-specific integrase [uncultured Chryseobacterium sp.]
MDYRIDFYLDTRRVLKNNLYPVKLRVYSNIEKKTKLYDIKKSYNREDYEQITKPKVSKKFIEESIYLEAIKNKANDIAKNITPFDFDIFEKNYSGNRYDKTNLIDFYNDRIEELEKNDQIGNAQFYRSSLNAIKKFINEKNPANVNNIHIMTIKKDWLKRFEKHLEKENKSISTIGAYLRPLRAIYNIALKENSIYEKTSPFNKGYQLPSSTKVKKALTKKDLRKLLEAEPKTQEQQKAKDFWFFSFYANGMNINDVARLRYKDFDFEAKKFYFIRNKVKSSKRHDLFPIDVFINDFLSEVIEKYKVPFDNKNQHIFSIVSDTDDEKQKKMKINNFIRFINQHIKKLAKDNEITSDVSVNWARHTFTTLGVNASLTLEELRQFLGHNNIRTTQVYVGSIEDENKQKITEKIYNF